MNNSKKLKFYIITMSLILIFLNIVSNDIYATTDLAKKEDTQTELVQNTIEDMKSLKDRNHNEKIKIKDKRLIEIVEDTTPLGRPNYDTDKDEIIYHIIGIIMVIIALLIQNRKTAKKDIKKFYKKLKDNKKKNIFNNNYNS